MKPLILLANDDGIHARGLAALAERLADLGDVMVVAPDRERSATSHAFTMNRPLRVEEVRPGWFSVDGTPVDCVYIGVLRLVPRKPALLVSGINHGFNLGSDVFYSGTVACAVEGAIRGVPSFAVKATRAGIAAASSVFASGLPRSSRLPCGTSMSAESDMVNGPSFQGLLKRLCRPYHAEFPEETPTDRIVPCNARTSGRWPARSPARSTSSGSHGHR